MGCAITIFSLFEMLYIYRYPYSIPAYLHLYLYLCSSLYVHKSHFNHRIYLFSYLFIALTVISSISQVLFNFLSLSLSFFFIVILFLSFCPLIQGYLRSGDIAEFDADNHPKVQCVTTVFYLLFLS